MRKSWKNEFIVTKVDEYDYFYGGSRQMVGTRTIMVKLVTKVEDWYD